MHRSWFSEECWYIKWALQVETNQSGSVELAACCKTRRPVYIQNALSLEQTQSGKRCLNSGPIQNYFFLKQKQVFMQKSGDASFTVHLSPDDNSRMTRAITLRYRVDFNSSSDAVGNKNVNAARFQPVYKGTPWNGFWVPQQQNTNIYREECFGKNVSAIILARLDPKYEQKRQKERDGRGLL